MIHLLQHSRVISCWFQLCTITAHGVIAPCLCSSCTWWWIRAGRETFSYSVLYMTLVALTEILSSNTSYRTGFQHGCLKYSCQQKERARLKTRRICAAIRGSGAPSCQSSPPHWYQHTLTWPCFRWLSYLMSSYAKGTQHLWENET